MYISIAFTGAWHIKKFSFAQLLKFPIFFNTDYIWFRRKLFLKPLAWLAVLLAQAIRQWDMSSFDMSTQLSTPHMMAHFRIISYTFYFHFITHINPWPKSPIRIPEVPPDLWKDELFVSGVHVFMHMIVPDTTMITNHNQIYHGQSIHLPRETY